MTFTAVKKLASKLPLRDRLKLADAMWESVPPMREPSTLEELERRADEIESGKVKPVPASEIDVLLARFEKTIQERRSAQRGKRPAPANSRIKGAPSARIR